MPRWRVGLALAAFLVAAGVTGAPAKAAYTWEGVWRSTFGDIKMNAGGSGTYPGGTITGEISGFEGRTNKGTWKESSTAGKYQFLMSDGGRSFDGTYERDGGGCVFPPCDWDGTCLSGPCLENEAPDKDDPAKGVAKVLRISGEVTAKKRGRSARVLKAGDTVGSGVELFTDIDAEVTLVFPDGAVMTVKEMSQVLISDLLNEGSRQTIRVSVRLGELNATVNPQKAFQSDFKVTIPYVGSGSVRGTKFSVFYDPVAKVALVSVREGTVAWDPVAPGLAEVMVTAGKEIEATKTSVSAPAALGKAGARGGVNRVKARDLVLSRIDRAKKCSLKTPRSRSVFEVEPRSRGWLVSVKVRGEAKGTSKWRVRGGKARPKNRLARRITRGCP